MSKSFKFYDGPCSSVRWCWSKIHGEPCLFFGCPQRPKVVSCFQNLIAKYDMFLVVMFGVLRKNTAIGSNVGVKAVGNCRVRCEFFCFFGRSESKCFRSSDCRVLFCTSNSNYRLFQLKFEEFFLLMKVVLVVRGFER